MLLNCSDYFYCTFHLCQFSFDLYLTFSSLNEPTWESRESFDICVSRII